MCSGGGPTQRHPVALRDHVVDSEMQVVESLAIGGQVLLLTFGPGKVFARPMPTSVGMEEIVYGVQIAAVGHRRDEPAKKLLVLLRHSESSL